ncbi:MAG TPA: PilZ domain-containing protein [Polyangiales bacterium]|nr:PilZ domain-containing protein [Polyangiales bacterium]
MTAMLWERRKFFRIPISGKALLQHGEHLDGLYRLHDLSMGGCMLTDGPVCKLGDRVALTLRVDGEEELALPAKVVRHERVAASERDGVRVGLRFTDHDPLFEDRIQDLVMRSIEREHQIEILVVHANPERVTALFDSMRGVGQKLVVARTAREAILQLERAGERMRMAIVAPVVGSSRARDIVKLISLRFPHVNCVTLSRGGAARVVRAIRNANRVDSPESNTAKESSAWSLSRLRKVIRKHELTLVTTTA